MQDTRLLFVFFVFTTVRQILMKIMIKKVCKENNWLWIHPKCVRIYQKFTNCLDNQRKIKVIRHLRLLEQQQQQQQCARFPLTMQAHKKSRSRNVQIDFCLSKMMLNRWIDELMNVCVCLCVFGQTFWQPNSFEY